MITVALPLSVGSMRMSLFCLNDLSALQCSGLKLESGGLTGERTVATFLRAVTASLGEIFKSPYSTLGISCETGIFVGAGAKFIPFFNTSSS